MFDTYQRLIQLFVCHPIVDFLWNNYKADVFGTCTTREKERMRDWARYHVTTRVQEEDYRMITTRWFFLRVCNGASDGIDIEGEGPKRKGRHVATQMENRNWNTNSRPRSRTTFLIFSWFNKKDWLYYFWQENPDFFLLFHTLFL